MNRRVTKKAVAGLMAVLTLSGQTGVVYAAEASTVKEENVYATLNLDGSVNGIYVVNAYDLTESTDIIDYGTYESVKNLTSEDKISVSGDELNVTSEEGKFYYQGNLESKDMPWNIAIRYVLDGEEINADDLGGKDGNLQILISVTQNKAVDATFFENYLLQVSMSLDTDICDNIVADGATMANVGSEKQIAYNILSGNEKEIEISCDVKNFSMGQISFKGVSSSFDINSSSIDTSSITTETSKITEAAEKINDGATSVSDGVSSLSSGSDKISDALSTLDSKSDSLTSGSSQVLDALNTMNTKLAKISVSSADLSKLVSASASVQDGIDALSSGISKVDSALDYDTVDDSIWSGLSKQSGGTATEANKDKLESALTSDTLSSQLAALPDGDLKTAFTNYIAAAQSYVSINNAYDKGLETYLDTVTGSVSSKSGTAYLASAAKQLSSSYKEFDTQIQALETSLSSLASNMTTLKTGINELVQKYTTLDSGITDYADAVSQILAGYSELEDGMDALQSGTNELKEGTETFADQTSDLDRVVDEKIDSMIDSLSGNDFETVSFVSSKNTNVEAVQFVMTTEEIEEPEAEVEEAVAESKGFWEKFLDLFR